MRKVLAVLFCVSMACCNQGSKETFEKLRIWEPYDDAADVAANTNHEIKRMRYRLIQSKVLDKNDVFLPLYDEVSVMTEETYKALKPLILEQNIFSLQKGIKDGLLTYEHLVLFYLYRIYEYELDNKKTLNTILALNQNVLDEARALDVLIKNGATPESTHPIYGMPILLKDNINTIGMNTTAGAIALMDNVVDDAFIVAQLKQKGALILGKVNLSEWAYFLCSGCPVGYSAVGGQTMNPYGRGVFETGGSSSGSGTSVAANYAVAAVGTETSGSILSPSSQNSVVGLKPTIGLLSRSGIVPISSTLDTPGPMTKNIIDNAILLSAMMGYDMEDVRSVNDQFPGILSAGLHPIDFKEIRLGAFSTLMESDSVYKATVESMRSLGAEIIEFIPPEVTMDGFSSILNIDMRNDLPNYLEKNTDSGEVKIRGIADAVTFNSTDSLLHIPYGQALFHGILVDSTSVKDLEEIKQRLENSGRTFFDTVMDTKDLDAVLSINNYHAGYAAVAKYPALTVPMGYKNSGEPISLTFIAKQFKEVELLRLGAAYEKTFRKREMPMGYR
ncbi:amidase family protein [Maribacter antarcticus]|uniref:amidase family protein n=1 Tax=Maribacter antarcticus TaxID=505250 RepID=UPI00047E3A85|nr:amidase family protein [Maribacter antarcticus]